MSKDTENKEWCPTTKGNTWGYIPEYYNHDSKSWEKIKTKRVMPTNGVLGPALHGGVLGDLHLMGYAQAQAIAWQHRAFCESEWSKLPLHFQQVRVTRYEVQFDLKARPVDSKELDIIDKPHKPPAQDTDHE